MKTLILVRGVPGSGKSTFAHLISENGTYPVFEADKFFEDASGNYQFDANKLNYVHESCFNHTLKALKSGIEKVIVSNTSVRLKDVNKYKELAESFGYQFTSIVVENHHGNSSVHNVPEEKVVDMRNTLKSNLSL